MIVSFRDLDAWKEAHKLVLLIYKSTSKFPQTETFALTNQIRRAVVSISSNLAEGFGRSSPKEKLAFYHNSRGSLTEVENQVIIARDLKYIDDSEYQAIMTQIQTSARLIQGLINKTKTYVK